jgi:hypothetical protein
VKRGGIHGDYEQITVEHYHNFIQFYIALVLNADRPVGGHSASRHQRALKRNNKQIINSKFVTIIAIDLGQV